MLKTKLLSRFERNTWEQIKNILEENYLVKRRLEYNTGILFNYKQDQNQSVIQWGARLDNIAMDLRREM